MLGPDVDPRLFRHFCYRCGELIIQSTVGHEISAAKAAHYINCDMYAEVPRRAATPILQQVAPVEAIARPLAPAHAPQREHHRARAVHRLLAGMFRHDSDF